MAGEGNMSGSRGDLDGLVTCTTCSRPFLDRLAPARHPEVGVLVCHTCLGGLAAEPLVKGSDGWHDLCTWCHLGGDLNCCAGCPRTFCSRCMSANLGTVEAAAASVVEDWRCYICRPQVPALRRLQRQCDETILRHERGEPAVLCLELDAAGSWRCPVAWCTTTSPSEAATIEHLRSSPAHRPAVLALRQRTSGGSSSAIAKPVAGEPASGRRQDQGRPPEGEEGRDQSHQPKGITNESGASAAGSRRSGLRSAPSLASGGSTFDIATAEARDDGLVGSPDEILASFPQPTLLVCPRDGCKETYTSKGGLRLHLRKIHGNAPGKPVDAAKKEQRAKRWPVGHVALCPVDGCDNSYSSKGGLQYHLRKAHNCDDAKVPLMISNVQTVHMPVSAIHRSQEVRSEAVVHKCTHPGCEKQFTSAGGLLYHTKNGHVKGERKANPCPRGCGKTFISALGLQYHVKNVADCMVKLEQRLKRSQIAASKKEEGGAKKRAAATGKSWL